MKEQPREQLFEQLQNELTTFHHRQIDPETMAWFVKKSSAALQNSVQKLTLNDLDLIDVIADHPNERLSDYANYLTIRQGTVSKSITKLAREQLVVKFHQGENKKTTFVKLLPLGQQLYALHRQYHRDNDRRLKAVLDRFSDDDLAIVARFLQVVNESE
ncbi:MarR family winged helix-turn-helix transcriptional regulator [Lapidilactobacillus bayanensis]|uniref:MarR family winged helix-turn-helix transcriptional regulator n=1 Tax=Lapidilactobacillus bayanensis TaxID=2485998 RepID=UPI000F7847DB|nr:winged helix DNA-binding protein [Lapidilactobacillus bayanensis]